MTLHRLSWRIGVPFVLLVLCETVTLVVYMTMQIAAEERARLEQLAATDAAFMANYTASDRMARELGRVTGHAVYFRRGGELIPTPDDAARLGSLGTIPADGRAHRDGELEAVAAPIDASRDLLLVRQRGHELRDPRILQVLVAFWLLASLIAWLLVRGLVRPLQHLAAQLPRIESPGSLELPEASRRDEIGDVARSFLRTRQALQDEREHRARIEKLAVLGRMTASLAHEIQNPVAAIKMHAQLCRGGPADAIAGTIEHEASRIESLLNQWLFLSRPEPPIVQPVDVAQLLAQVVRSNQAQLDHAQVAVDLQAAGTLTVQGDGKRLGQVFFNVLGNAIQAMSSGGTLNVRARLVDDAVEVRFLDQGKGFSTTALARFAEFFFSEKEGGMGIGLTVANEIVKAHGGSLQASNRAEGGACVTVILPREGSMSVMPGSQP